MTEFTIYYADDDEDDLLFFEEAVQSLSKKIGLKINLCILKNGDNLIKTIDQNLQTEGVVFLDLNMPYKSGFELLEEIRKKHAISKTPVIIYSTSANDENISRSKALGANYYAIKPHSFKDLLGIISNAVKMDWKSYSPNPEPFIFNQIAS